MPKPKRPPVSPRKQPVQERSAQLVKDILKAAVRVLSREGAAHFTTLRVAEAAGVSVGSLYQYFPNKQSILFQLQVDEWEQTSRTIDAILGDTSKPWRLRLRTMIRAFFRSECEEAPLRLALDAAAPEYHDAPEARATRRRSGRIAATFLAEVMPNASLAERRFAAELMFVTITAVGKRISEGQPGRARVDRFAHAVADMLEQKLGNG